ncbi:MAG TPA: MmgE/PrpD family protein, partial [Candidatus Krumholzibacterium sp.]|nr:MmgE/PrpD family protein [Candidatus Krumholzibacterium sp.]
ASAIALSETTKMTGRELISAIAIGNEIACRVGSVASGQFHKRGLHPTGLFAPFGVAYLAAKVLDLSEAETASAAGIVGSFASGLLECWVDGTESKFLHAGWAAQGGITAAHLARRGITGPPRVFEGRFGLFESHLQDPNASPDYGRIRDDLGMHWESRNSSFKPFPAAHVLHPYIDAALRLVREQGINAGNIEEIRCPVAEFIVPIVCEPVAEKQAPRTTAHGRVTLQYTLAEAICRGELGREAYQEEALGDPEILGLASRVRHYVDPQFPGPGRFKGAVEVRLKDGRFLLEVEEHTRGSRENPMSYEELRAKFDDNSRAFLNRDQQDNVARTIARLETL